MSRQIKYDDDRIRSYRDRSVNLQTYVDVRMLADIVHAMRLHGALAKELTGSGVLRMCVERVHSAMCSVGDAPTFSRVEDARTYLADNGFSMRQLGDHGTYGGREYVKSLVIQDRLTEEGDDAFTKALEEASDVIDAEYGHLSKEERWEKVRGELKRRGFDA